MRAVSRCRCGAAAVVVAALAVAGCGSDGRTSSRASKARLGTTTAVPVTTTPLPAVEPTTTTTVVATPDVTVAPATTVPEPAPATTVARPRPNPGVLEVVDGSIELAPGKYIDSFAVRNAGGEPMYWVAVGVPGTLILKTTNGTLEPGEFKPVLVTVKAESLPAGPFNLTFHISANDTAQPVTVAGTKV